MKSVKYYARLIGVLFPALSRPCSNNEIFNTYLLITGPDLDKSSVDFVKLMDTHVSVSKDSFLL